MLLSVVVVLCLSPALSAAQDNTPPEVTITGVSRDSFDRILNITYDVFDADHDTLDIRLLYSTDGGLTFADSARTVTGDFGSEVLIGSALQMAWAFGQDDPAGTLDGEEIILRVLARDYSTGSLTVIVDWSSEMLFGVIDDSGAGADLSWFRIDGSELLSLDHALAVEGSADWTGIGSAIATVVQKDDSGVDELVLWEIDGGAETVLASGPEGEDLKHPRFQDPETLLYLGRDTQGMGTLHRAAASGAPLDPISMPPSVQGRIVWFDTTPVDGRVLVILSTADPAIQEILLLDAEFDGIVVEKSVDAIESQPALAPSGGQLVYTAATDDGGSNLMLLTLETADRSALTNAAVGEVFDRPVWSADGRTVACRFADGEQSDILIIDVQSGAVQQLTDTPNLAEYPLAWR